MSKTTRKPISGKTSYSAKKAAVHRTTSRPIAPKKVKTAKTSLAIAPTPPEIALKALPWPVYDDELLIEEDGAPLDILVVDPDEIGFIAPKSSTPVILNIVSVERGKILSADAHGNELLIEDDGPILPAPPAQSVQARIIEVKRGRLQLADNN